MKIVALVLELNQKSSSLTVSEQEHKLIVPTW